MICAQSNNLFTWLIAPCGTDDASIVPRWKRAFRSLYLLLALVRVRERKKDQYPLRFVHVRVSRSLVRVFYDSNKILWKLRSLFFWSKNFGHFVKRCPRPKTKTSRRSTSAASGATTRSGQTNRPDAGRCATETDRSRVGVDRPLRRAAVSGADKRPSDPTVGDDARRGSDAAAAPAPPSSVAGSRPRIRSR